MSGILNIGVTALLGHQRALGVTGNNIANVNTEGYTRQTVHFGTRTPQFSGLGFLGTGVQITDIERIHSEVLNEELRNATSQVGDSNIYLKFSSQLNNLVTNADVGIAPAMQDFFNAVSDVANDPASISARQVMIAQGDELSNRFAYFHDRFDQINRGLNEEMRTAVTEVNSITASIASLNENIVLAAGAANGKAPNDLLDQRDQLLNRLSEHIAVTVIEEQDSSINVFMGRGQLIVNRFRNQELDLVQNDFDPAVLEISFTQNGLTTNISEQITGGTLGGVLGFRSQVFDPAQNALGRIALTFAREFNEQHQLGIDLNNNAGGNFFSEPPTNILASSNNTGIGDMSLEVTDLQALTLKDYQLTFNGGNQYTLLTLPEKTLTPIDASSGYPLTVNIDGLTLTINSAPNAGDTFLLQPTRRNAGNFGMELQNADEIAAALPVRAETNLNSTGSAELDNVLVFDQVAYVPDSYQVVFGDDAGAGVGGPQGVPIDADADAGDVLEYSLRINDVLIHTQGEADAPLATLNDLAAAINAQESATGVRAYVDNGSGQLYLANNPASANPIEITENFAATAGALEAGDSVTGYFGSTLDDTTVSNTQVLTPAADSYIVVDSGGTTVTSGAYTNGGDIDFNGIRVQVSGVPNVGDIVDVAQNTGGAGDNRNALALANLRNQSTINAGTTSYQESYGQLVANVGTRTHQSELSFNAQSALMNSTKDERESMSGVNLDEEAANMLRYQQAYQAAARVVGTANDLFQNLLSVLGR